MLDYIFQFLLPGKISSIAKILTSAHPARLSFIFDLEDGVQDVLFAERTSPMKQQMRKNLFLALKDNQGSIKVNQHGIRINSIESPEFENDFEFLSKASDFINWKYIVLPKINCRSDVEICRRKLETHQIRFTEIIPIVESKKGVENIKEIVSENPSDSFHRLFFGHHDYNLDCGFWPFLEQDSKEFWELTTLLIKSIEDAGYGFINPPLLQLNNDLLLKKIVSATGGICKRHFGQAALCRRQALVLINSTEFAPSSYKGLIQKKISDGDTSILSAEQMMMSFEKNYSAEKSFSISAHDSAMISPQQYLAAKKHLAAQVVRL